MLRMRYEREEIATRDYRATREYLEIDTDERGYPHRIGPDGDFPDCDPEDFDEIAREEEERYITAEETDAIEAATAPSPPP